MSHRRQFLAELVVATIVADGTEGNLALLCFTLCLAYFGSEPTGVGYRYTRRLLCRALPLEPGLVELLLHVDLVLELPSELTICIELIEPLDELLALLLDLHSLSMPALLS